MRNVFKTAVVAVAVALGAALPAAAQVSDEEIVTVALPDAQFRSFLLQTVSNTDTFKRGFVALGPDEGCAAFAPAFAAAFEKHAPAWRSNLVAAWRDHVPAELLEQAVAAGPGEAGRMVAPHGDAIGTAMEASSKPLLNDASAQLLAALAEATSAVDMETVDQPARIAALNALDTRNLCGVLGDVALPARSREAETGERPGPEQGR